jgi:hypothetical protein
MLRVETATVIVRCGMVWIMLLNDSQFPTATDFLKKKFNIHM